MHYVTCFGCDPNNNHSDEGNIESNHCLVEISASYYNKIMETIYKDTEIKENTFNRNSVPFIISFHGYKENAKYIVSENPTNRNNSNNDFHLCIICSCNKDTNDPG